jgi:hypothetical protein
VKPQEIALPLLHSKTRRSDFNSFYALTRRRMYNGMTNFDALEGLAKLLSGVAISGRRDSARTAAAGALLSAPSSRLSAEWQRGLGHNLRLIGWTFERKARGAHALPIQPAGGPAVDAISPTKKILAAAHDAKVDSDGARLAAASLKYGKSGKKRNVFEAASKAQESADKVSGLVASLATEHSELKDAHKELELAATRLKVTAEAANKILLSDPSNDEDHDELLDILEELGLDLRVMAEPSK